MPRDHEHPVEQDRAKSRRWGLTLLVVLLLPELIALWCVPWFVSQDGPAHLYNAHIMNESLRAGSSFRGVYEVHWSPLPNLMGHLTLMVLLMALPAQWAEHAILSITLLGFVASMVWLRWLVVGWRGMPVAAALMVLLGLNTPWLMGFTSFLLGACLFPITLGTWWGGRERMRPGRAVALAGLLILGFFCHPVSLGLTVAGLAVLAATTPGARRRARQGWTVASVLPLIPLGIMNHGMLGSRAGQRAEWICPLGYGEIEYWAFRWVRESPVFLTQGVGLPFLDAPLPWSALLTPAVYLDLALLILAFATLARTMRRSPSSDSIRSRRGWPILAMLLFLAGSLCPDAIGVGSFLPQRVLLLALVALLPVLETDWASWGCRVGGLLIAAAVLAQGACIWDYAIRSGRTAGVFMQAMPHVGTGHRIATLLVDPRGPYQAWPLVHIDNMLGIGTGNILWYNYETDYPSLFPVRFRASVRRPGASTFDDMIWRMDSEDERYRIRRWGRLMDLHHDEIDFLVVWGADPRLDAINARWFDVAFREGEVRVLKRVAAGDRQRVSP